MTVSQESVAGNSPEKGFSPVPTPVGRAGGAGEVLLLPLRPHLRGAIHL